MRYCADDVPKRTYLPPVLGDLEAFPHRPTSSNSTPTKNSFSTRVRNFYRLCVYSCFYSFHT